MHVAFDQTMVFLGGIHSLGFALFHMAFWKLFRWNTDLKNCSIPNRAILQIANLRLIYLFLAVGAACLLIPRELTDTRLGQLFLAAMSLFWLGRLVEQFIFLPYNRLEVHALSALFLLGAILFAWPLV